MTLPLKVPVRETVNSAVSPSVTVASSMARVGSGGVVGPPSLSLMAPVAVSSSMVAPVGLLRVTVKVSVDSPASSSVVSTEIVCEVLPVNVRVPEAAV